MTARRSRARKAAAQGMRNRMLKLNDRQMQALMAAASRIPSALRDPFLRRAANSLHGVTIDDRIVHAAISAAVKALAPRVRAAPTLFATSNRRKWRSQA